MKYAQIRDKILKNEIFATFFLFLQNLALIQNTFCSKPNEATTKNDSNNLLLLMHRREANLYTCAMLATFNVQDPCRWMLLSIFGNLQNNLLVPFC